MINENLLSPANNNWRSSDFLQMNDAQLTRILAPIISLSEAFAFDLDGTLRDSERRYFEVFKSALSSQKLKFDYDQYIAGCIGKTIDEGERFVSMLHPSVEFDRFKSDWREHWDRRIFSDPIDFKEGAKECLAILKDRKIPIALVTSSERQEVEQMGRTDDFLSYFTVIITANDVVSKKPHPEPYLMAAEKLEVSPVRMITVEDSIDGRNSALAAGTSCIWIPDRPTLDSATDSELKFFQLSSMSILLPLLEQFLRD